MQDRLGFRFALAWSFPATIAWVAWQAPAWAGIAALSIQVLLALLERVPALRESPVAAPMNGWHRTVPRVHVLFQAALLALALWLLMQPGAGWREAIALGFGVGAVAGSQGITFAHELGHSRNRFDRFLGWLLMVSVNYAHFMVEHYRGHHPRAATWEDPASARRGESLWAFLPRTVVGSWRSAWNLEFSQLRQLHRSLWASPLLWATAAQGAWLLLLWAAFGPKALVFWLLQSAYAVFLLEAVNYVEHYGLQREVQQGRREPFGVMHAWNADAALTNCLLLNLQRHSDHHTQAWKPYATLEALPGPQLPTGYAGVLFLASVPRLWFKLMHPRLDALAAASPPRPPAPIPVG